MKLLKNIFSSLLLILLFSAKAFAFDAKDAEAALNSYNALQEQIFQAAQQTPKPEKEKHAKSISTIIIEGYAVTGSGGLTFASRQTIPGLLSVNGVHQIATPLYERNGFGVYQFQGQQVQVWYSGNYASVITVMVPANL